MMAMITPTAGTPYVKKDELATGDVSGIVGLTGDKTGTVSVSFDKNCAITIVKNMLGGELEDIIQDVKDAVGEITNMVSGQARRGLSEVGITLQAGTPTVIMGDNHRITHVGNGPVMAIPFRTDHGDFTIEVSLQDN
ncbi:MAG: chemotaxis protein CheX [Desulfovibrio sp.]